MNISDLKTWVEERGAIPNEEDELFKVSSFTITPQKVDFIIFFTTGRLKSFTQSEDHIAADATFKLTWINYPVYPNPIVCHNRQKQKLSHLWSNAISSSN